MEALLLWYANNTELAWALMSALVPGLLAHIKALIPADKAEKLGWINTVWDVVSANYKHTANAKKTQEKPPG